MKPINFADHKFLLERWVRTEANLIRKLKYAVKREKFSHSPNNINFANHYIRFEPEDVAILPTGIYSEVDECCIHPDAIAYLIYFCEGRYMGEGNGMVAIGSVVITDQNLLDSLLDGSYSFS